MDQLTTNLKTNFELSFEISKEAIAAGLIVRYDTISYRDQEINFVSDVTGTQCFAQWNGELVDLGLHNIYYKEDMCRFVDRKLDFITDFRDCPDFVGAKLEYFNNSGYRDIKLSYQGRIIKVFLVHDAVDETLLITEAQRLLRLSGLLESPSEIT